MAVQQGVLGWCIRQDLNLQPSDPKSEYAVFACFDFIMKITFITNKYDIIATLLPSQRH